MNTAQCLKTWLSENMCQVSFVTDLETVCSGPMDEVWQWISQHVRAREDVRKIRGNLALSSAVAPSDRSCTSSRVFDTNTERKRMLCDRSRLMAELHAILMKVQRLRRKMDHVKAEQVKLDNKKSEMTRDVEQRRQRIALLLLYSRQSEKLLSKLSSVTTKMIQSEENKSFQTAPKTIISSGAGVVSEENVMIAEAVSNCAGYFRGVLSGHVGPGRISFKQDVVRSLGKLSRESIKTGLIHHTKILTQGIVAQTEKYSKPVAELDDDAVFETVQGDLSNFCLRHIKSNREMVKLEKSCNVLEEKLAKYQDQLSGGESGQKATEVENLHKSLNQLNQRISNNNVFPNIANINAQQEEIDGLCQIISSLIMRSSSYNPKPYQLKILEILSTVHLMSRDVGRHSQPLQDLPSSHLKSLSSIPTRKLSCTMVSGEGLLTMSKTCQLSILRNYSKTPQIPLSLESRRQDLVLDVISLVQEVNDLKKKTLEESDHVECSNIVRKLSQTEDMLSRNLLEQSRNLMPVIEDCKAGHEKVLKLFKSFRRVQQDWKTEPGLDIALSYSNHWGEVEGRTLQQTVDLAKHYLNPKQKKM